MKRIIFLSISLTPLVFGDSIIDTSELFSKRNCSKVIEKSTYTACYDYDFKSSKAIKYTLFGDEVNKLNIKQRPRFYSEYSIPKKHRAHYNDFYSKALQRGHIRSDASSDFDYAKLKETYSLVNIVAQYKYVNKKMWYKAEKYSRSIAVKLGSVDVLNIIEYSSYPKRIGRNRVAVPKGFYKILTSGTFKKCFFYQNLPYSKEYAKKDTLRNHIIDCSIFK